MKVTFWITLSALIAMSMIGAVVCQPEATPTDTPYAESVPADTPYVENVPAPAYTPYVENVPIDYRITLRTYNDSDCQHLAGTYHVINDIDLCQNYLDDLYFKGHCVNGTLGGLIFWDARCEGTAIGIKGSPGCVNNHIGGNSINVYGDYTCPPPAPPSTTPFRSGDSAVVLPSMIASCILLAFFLLLQ